MCCSWYYMFPFYRMHMIFSNAGSSYTFQPSRSMPLYHMTSAEWAAAATGFIFPSVQVLSVQRYLGIDPAWWALWNQWFRTSCLGPISCQSQSLQVNPCLISQCSNACLEYEGREDPDSTWGWDQRSCARLDVLANGALVNILHLGTDCINHQSVCGPECPQGNKRNSCSLWWMKKTVSETTGRLERRWWLYCGSSLILPTMLEKQAWTLLNSAVNWSVNYLIMLSMAVKTQFWHNKEIVQ